MLLTGICAVMLCGTVFCGTARGWSQAGSETPVITLPPALQRGRDLLQAHQFQQAQALFTAYLGSHPGDVQAELGLGDAQLGLHHFEAAEITYRSAVAVQPELWQAHKDLVVVEAALGRWEEFDRERTVLRMARQRQAPGISRQESDLIDSFNAGGGHWIVRAYFQPLGRSRALYNFERFSPEGRVQAYLSLEDQAAAKAALTPGDEKIGLNPPVAMGDAPSVPLALNWYTGVAHGTIRSYPSGAPSYEHLRQDVIHWLQRHPASTGVHPAERETQHQGSSRSAEDPVPHQP